MRTYSFHFGFNYFVHYFFISPSPWSSLFFCFFFLLLPAFFFIHSFVFLLQFAQLTKLVDELVPLRLPKVTGGAPEALQMPGGQVRIFVKFLHAKESQINLFLFVFLFCFISVSVAVSLSAPAKQLSD